MPHSNPSKPARPRRFYQRVDVAAHEAGYVILLDGRAPKSPARSPLVAPTLALAECLAKEWADQGEAIDALSMPAVRLAYTAIDRIPATRGAVAENIARYGGSDVLCHFACAPAELVEMEQRAWMPWTDWARRTLHVALEPVTGMSAKAQPTKALSRLASLAAAESDFSLAGLAFGAALYGSAVLAFAVRHGATDALSALEISWVDETFQASRWGIDAEAEARRQALKIEAVMLQDWFTGLSSSP